MNHKETQYIIIDEKGSVIDRYLDPITALDNAQMHNNSTLHKTYSVIKEEVECL